MFYDERNMGKILDIIEKSVNVPQKDEFHPEGDVRNHTLQVFYHSTRESNDPDLLMAALTHDVGKTSSDQKGHEKDSVDFLIGLSVISDKTLWLVANHMRIRPYIEGEMRGLRKAVTFVNHPWFVDLVKLNRWDNMGRNPKRKMKFDREDILVKLNECKDMKYNFEI